MNVGAPILDVVPGARGHVLRALCQSERGVSGRELARRAGLPPSTTLEHLADLVKSGLVLMSPFMDRSGFRLNEDHLLARAVKDLASAHMELTKRIRDHVAAWPIQPTAGWLYGSAARGTGDRGSDIDILFIWPQGEFDHEAWDELQIAALVVYVHDLTGNFVQIAQYSVETFFRLESEKSPFTANLRVDGIDLVEGSWRQIAQASRK